MSLPTFLLTHWVRDRTRGERIPVETVVAKQTSRNAQLYGMDDRGLIKAGKRADINVIDLPKLSIDRPRMHRDLPGGGARLLQRSTGYVATMVGGVVTRRDDEQTGARPGRVLRS